MKGEPKDTARARHHLIGALLGAAAIIGIAALLGLTGSMARTEVVHAAACELDVDKEADVSEVVPGGEITYTIEVTNDGSGRCDDVELTDTIPSHTDCVDTSDTATGCDASGDVEWDLGDIDDDETEKVTMTVEVDADATVGSTIKNKATAKETGIPYYDTDSSSTVKTTVVAAVPTPTPTTIVLLPTPTPRAVAPTPTPFGGPAPVGIMPPPTGTAGLLAEGSSYAQTIAAGLAALGLVLFAGAIWVRRTS